MSAIQNFSLRRASNEDIPWLMELERKSIPHPWSMEHWQQELSSSHSQILLFTDDETDSVVAGAIVFWLVGDECQIQLVAVDSPYRGLGFGARLVRESIKTALRAQKKKCVLEVRKSNAAAVGLYQSVGFAIDGVRKGFYSDGEDAYQMVLSLEGGVPSQF